MLPLTPWFLATNSDYRTVGHLFGVSKPTICVVTKEVCAAIMKILLTKHIRIPTGDGFKAVIVGFKDKLGFPQCVGVVDGTHIPIVSPVDCPADYYNRKGWHSIITASNLSPNLFVLYTNKFRTFQAVSVCSWLYTIPHA